MLPARGEAPCSRLWRIEEDSVDGTSSLNATQSSLKLSYSSPACDPPSEVVRDGADCASICVRVIGGRYSDRRISGIGVQTCRRQGGSGGSDKLAALHLPKCGLAALL